MTSPTEQRPGGRDPGVEGAPQHGEATESGQNIPPDPVSDKPTPFLAEMERHARLLGVGAGEVHELRVLAEDGIRTGLFDDPATLASAAEGFDGDADVYVSLNAMALSVTNTIRRAATRNGSAPPPFGYAFAASDEDVAGQVHLFIDVDPVRAEGFTDHCATDGEHRAALDLRETVRAFIDKETGASPLVLDTGNGGALVYRLTGPAGQVGVKRVLDALAHKFDAAAAHVDRTVHNPSRIHRLAGTLNLKKAAPDRPQRRCRLEQEGGIALDLGKLEGALGLAPQQAGEPPPGPTTTLTPEEVAKVVAAWTAGARHAIAGPVAGVLRKAGWPQAAAENLVREVCAAAGDAEVEDRLRFVRDTYSKHEEEVAGWSALEESGLDPADFPSLREEEAPGVPAKKSDAGALVKLGLKLATFVHDGARVYAQVQRGDHRELIRLRGLDFRRWLAGRFYEAEGRPAGSEAIGAALTVLEAKAMDAPLVDVFVRVAPGPKGEVYLDLGDAKWRGVEISASLPDPGWRLVDEHPVYFRRAGGMLPLPDPKPGSLIELREHLNLEEDGDWTLVAGWLVAAVMASGPYPTLGLHGEQGSAKSTAARMLRALIDPNRAPLRAEPKEPRDLMIAANNSWMQTLDNLSRMPDWLSNALCRLSTGGGFSARRLYTDEEESIFDAMRPAVLTGISEVAERGDLLDRSLLVKLPVIPESKRRPESEIWREFEEARPHILGGLFSAVATVLRERPKVKLATLPRMADFSITATAAESTFGVPAGTFAGAYDQNRAAANSAAVEGDPVALAVLALLATETEYEGAMSELLARLNQQADLRTQHHPGWPTSPRGLSQALRRVAPNLRAAGVAMELDSPRRDLGGRRLVFLRRAPGRSSGSSGRSGSSAPGENPQSNPQGPDGPQARDTTGGAEGAEGPEDVPPTATEPEVAP